MDNERKHIDFIDEPAEFKEEKKFSAKNLLDGSVLKRNWLIKQLPFIIFLTFLAILYIANRYHAERVVRDTVKLKSEVKELRFESITTASDLMFISKQSEVSRMVKEKNLGLKELTEPPSKLVLEKEKD